MATSAYMLGRDDEWMSLLERAHHVYVDAGEARRAAGCAGWIGMNLALRGEVGGATGWLARAQRLLEQLRSDCPERGWMLLPSCTSTRPRRPRGSGSPAAAAPEIGHASATRTCSRSPLVGQGYMLMKQGPVKEGLGLLDEAMVAVTTGELRRFLLARLLRRDLACEEVYELGRAGNGRRP